MAGAPVLNTLDSLMLSYLKYIGKVLPAMGPGEDEDREPPEPICR